MNVTSQDAKLAPLLRSLASNKRLRNASRYRKRTHSRRALHEQTCAAPSIKVIRSIPLHNAPRRRIIAFEQPPLERKQ